MKPLRVINSNADRQAERGEILDALTALIECFPNAPKKNLAAYAEKLLEMVLARRPSVGTLARASDRLIEANGFLPPIKSVLIAIDEAASSLRAVQVKTAVVDLDHLGSPGKLLLVRYGAGIAASWFKKLDVLEDRGAELALSVPSEFIRSRLLSDYAAEIGRCWRVSRPALRVIHFDVVGQRRQSYVLSDTA
ncbi:DnaA N-terminal domain-containing protein [Bradyrhizobium sp. LA6.12]|uniref:DnaA N-terminal domain-containing protein n=1 Tax=unclassified Bradyrhizobium TaxID=2631580 RepID=UPI003394389B